MLRRAAAKSVIAVLGRLDSEGECGVVLRQGAAKGKRAASLWTARLSYIRQGARGARPDSGARAVRPRGGVVTQRTANPCTPVRFRARPPLSSAAAGRDPGRTGVGQRRGGGQVFVYSRPPFGLCKADGLCYEAP